MRRTSHDETWAEIRASVNGSTRSSCLVLLSLGHLAWWRRSSCRILHGAQFLKYAGLADHQCFLHKDPKLHQLLLELRPGNMVRDEVKVGSVQIRQCKMLKAVAGTTASTLPVSQTLSPKLANKVNSRCVLMVAASYLKREVQLEVCMPKTCGGPEMSSCTAVALSDQGGACHAPVPRTGRLETAAAIATGTLQKFQSRQYQTYSSMLVGFR